MRERLGCGRVTSERPSAGEQLERHDAERVPVACRRRGRAPRLLWRDVARRPEDRPRRGQRVGARRGRDPEVRDVDVPIAVEQEIRRLHVAMDDAALMCTVERAGGLLEPAERLRTRRAARTQPFVHRAAVEVLHDDEWPAVVLGDVEDRHDVGRSGEACGGERLAPEARTRVVLARVPVREHLHRDRPFERGVGCSVHLAHPTVGDQIGGGIPPREHIRRDLDLVPDSVETYTAQRRRKPSPSGSSGSSVKTCSPVRNALPSTSVTTA